MVALNVRNRRQAFRAMGAIAKISEAVPQIDRGRSRGRAAPRDCDRPQNTDRIEPTHHMRIDVGLD